MTDLITLEEYKIAENITGMKEDNRLSDLITSVSQLVKTYCNNSFLDFYTTSKTELFDINHRESFVQLSETPLLVVSQVSERSSPTTDYVILSENQDYYIDRNTDSIYRVSGIRDKAFSAGRGSVKVIYTAGYSSTPEDLKLAVIDLITYYHKDHHRTARQTIAGASIQNNSSSSQGNNVSFPDHIKRVLDLYKNF